MRKTDYMNREIVIVTKIIILSYTRLKTN